MAKLDPEYREYALRPTRKGPRDVDQVARARLFKTAVWGVPAGMLLGVAAGFMLARTTGAPLGLSILALVVLFPFLILGFTLGLADAAGAAGSFVYAAPGGGTKARKDYSRAKALAAHGEYTRAADEFETHLAEDASDPQLYLELGRLYRDHMNDPEGAVRWFRQGIRDASPGPGMEILLTREAVEVIRKGALPVGTAAPLLSRLAERFPERLEGKWAARELEEVRGLMRQTGEGGGPSDPGP